jgi:hypothetical protein
MGGVRLEFRDVCDERANDRNNMAFSNVQHTTWEKKSGTRGVSLVERGRF